MSVNINHQPSVGAKSDSHEYQYPSHNVAAVDLSVASLSDYSSLSPTLSPNVLPTAPESAKIPSVYIDIYTTLPLSSPATSPTPQLLFSSFLSSLSSPPLSQSNEASLSSDPQKKSKSSEREVKPKRRKLTEYERTMATNRERARRKIIIDAISVLKATVPTYDTIEMVEIIRTATSYIQYLCDVLDCNEVKPMTETDPAEYRQELTNCFNDWYKNIRRDCVLWKSKRATAISNDCTTFLK